MKHLYPIILLGLLVACEEPAELTVDDLIEAEEEDAATEAQQYEELFVNTLARADEVNERFMMRLMALGDTVAFDETFNMEWVIQETEIDYIWEPALNDPRVIQGQVTIGQADGMGLDMKLYPELLLKMEGTAFTTSFGSETIAGGIGTASSEQTGSVAAIDIENDKTDRPNNGIVHLRLFIATEE